MNRNINSLHGATLEVVATLRDGEIRASIVELRERDKTTIALRSALQAGVPIEDLSDASGLTMTEIRRRVSCDLVLGDDVAHLTGVS